ncbi:hypothetical protein Tco_1475657 [Tanacetum coccineum]
MMLLARASTKTFSTPTNNRLCTSSNTRNQAVIQDGRVDIQTKNAGYGGNCNKNTRRQNKNQAFNAGIGNDERNQIVQRVELNQIRERQIIQPADGNAENVPSYDAKAVSEVNVSSKVHEQLAKKAFKERKNWYLEDIVDLEEKLSSQIEMLYLAKLGYKNLERLKKAIAAQPKMYDGEKLHSATLTIDSPDSEETLEDAEEKSPNSVRRPKSKDTKLKNRVLKKNNDKRPSAHVWKMSSSVSIDSNKREIINSNVCQSNASVLSTKIVNAINDCSNIVCVSCGKDVFLLSHEKCVARYALSRNSSVKRALFTTLIAAKSKTFRATSVVAKSRLSVAKTSTVTNKVSSMLSLSPDSIQSGTLSSYMKNKLATSRKWQKWFEYQQSFNWTPKSKTAQSLPSETKSRIRVRSTSNTLVTTQK